MIAPHRWEEDGIEGLIDDDGCEDGVSVTKKARQSIGINDLLDVLDAKYETIRKRLFWEMLKMETGLYYLCNNLHKSDRVEN